MAISEDFPLKTRTSQNAGPYVFWVADLSIIWPWDLAVAENDWPSNRWLEYGWMWKISAVYIYTHILYIYLWKATFLRSLNGHGVFELFSHLGVRAFCEVIKVPKNHPWFSQWANVGAWVLRYSPWYCCCLGRIWWLPHVWGKRKKRQYFWNKMQPVGPFSNWAHCTTKTVSRHRADHQGMLKRWIQRGFCVCSSLARRWGGESAWNLKAVL